MRRVFRLGLGRAIAREVDDELAFHLEMRTQKLIAAGLSPERARQEAQRQFGDVDSVRQFCVTMDEERERAMRKANLLDELRQDLVYATRMLRRNLAVTGVIVVTLALGIGANTAIFTLVNAILLRKLPVQAPDELIAIGDTRLVGSLSQDTGPDVRLISYPLYKDLRERNRLVSGLLASGRTSRLDVVIEPTGGAIERVRGRYVSGNFFEVLGVPALLGRTFGEREDGATGASPVVTISHAYWQRRFAGASDIVGREILINGQRLTIVGVTPPSFTGDIIGRSNDIWIPLTMQDVLMPNQRALADRETKWLLLLGRRLPGVTDGQATAGFTTLIRQLVLESNTQPGVAEQVRDMTMFVGPGAKGFSAVRASYATPLLTLMAGVGLLLLIICANVANLLLARAVARTREMSVRLAIGARRIRLVRQLLTESLMLALLGAAAGLLVARWGSRLLLALAADGASAIPVEARLDLPVLAFTMVLLVLAVGLFGLAPALRASRVDLASTMRAHATSVSGGALAARGQRVPVGKMLIAGQVALSLVLLVGAALLVRSLQRVQNVDTGLDRDHLLIVDVDAIARGYAGDRFFALVDDLSARLRRLGGVQAVSFSENGIFSGTESGTTIQVPGFIARSADDSIIAYDQVGPDYVRATGARLLQGRDIGTGDAARTANVGLVNETMSRFYFPKGDVVGRTIRIDTATVEIVGVIADTKDHDLTGEPVRRLYLAYRQGTPASLRFIVRATGSPSSLVTPVRAVLKAVDPKLSVDGIEPLSTLMRQSVREERLLARLASGFGLLALVLATIGLYGVMTYAITRRTSEIGLRVALGAQRGDVIRLVLTDAFRMVLLGFVIGAPLAWGSARLLRGQLFGIGASDPVSIIAALLMLAVSGLIAALLPALRAARVAPLVALRQE